MAVDRSFSDGSYVLCTSGFVHDVTCSHNGENGAKLKTTRMYRRISSSSPVGGTGAKSAVFDCILYSMFAQKPVVVVRNVQWVHKCTAVL